MRSGVVETLNKLGPHPQVVVKIRREISVGEVIPSEEQGVSALGFSAGDRSPCNFWLWKRVRIVTKGDKKLLETQCTGLLELTCSELQS